jgi:hypothetical protein
MQFREHKSSRNSGKSASVVTSGQCFKSEKPVVVPLRTFAVWINSGWPVIRFYAGVRAHNRW